MKIEQINNWLAEFAVDISCKDSVAFDEFGFNNGFGEGSPFILERTIGESWTSSMPRIG